MSKRGEKDNYQVRFVGGMEKNYKTFDEISFITRHYFIIFLGIKIKEAEPSIFVLENSYAISSSAK
jgi:hypothetical protein